MLSSNVFCVQINHLWVNAYVLTLRGYLIARDLCLINTLSWVFYRGPSCIAAENIFVNGRRKELFTVNYSWNVRVTRRMWVLAEWAWLVREAGCARPKGLSACVIGHINIRQMSKITQTYIMPLYKSTSITSVQYIEDSTSTSEDK